MSNFRSYLLLFPFVATGLVLLPGFKTRSTEIRRAETKLVIENQPISMIPDDTSQVLISPHIMRKYPWIYNLLKEIITKNDSCGLIDGLNICKSAKNRLIFIDKAFNHTDAAQTHPGRLDKFDSTFTDTIVLNRRFFKQASKDYMASVVIHECAHVYFNWSFLSHFENLNGVDSTYLMDHFGKRADWIASGQLFVSGLDRGHQLMSELYTGRMQQFILLFTNPLSPKPLQDSVALALAWGGLHGTPKWKDLGDIACFLESVDGWARNMRDVSEKSQFEEGNCITDKTFFDRLQLRLCYN